VLAAPGEVAGEAAEGKAGLAEEQDDRTADYEQETDANEGAA
jgi:hypothetical protein